MSNVVLNVAQIENTFVNIAPKKFVRTLKPLNNIFIDRKYEKEKI